MLPSLYRRKPFEPLAESNACIRSIKSTSRLRVPSVKEHSVVITDAGPVHSGT